MSKIRPSTQIMPEGTAGQVLRINPAGTAIEAATLPTSPSGGASSPSFYGGVTAAQDAPDADIWLPAHLADISFSTAAADRSVALAPSATWESGVLQEATVWYDATADEWRMIYTGGWASPALGYATAPHPSGPWTKYAGNPILGTGAGGWSGGACHDNVYIEGTTGYIYFPDNVNGGNLRVATFDTSDPTVLTVQSGTVLAPAGGALGIVNTSLVKDGSTYRMLFESRVSTSDQWNIGYATGTSPLGPFTINTFPLPTLQRGSGCYGGPWLERKSFTWVLVYHASTSGVLPTAIYRATSTDLINWTQDAGTFIDRVATPEVDQVADFCYQVDARGGWGFWEGMSNTAPSGSIMVSEAILPTPPQWWDGKTWRPLRTTMQDEGTALPMRGALNFVGAGVTATDDSANDRTIVTIPGGTTAPAGELLMQDGVTAPPVPLENEARSDWLYQG